MISHAEIIGRNGGISKFGHRIGVDPNTVKPWKRLNSIPCAYWRRIVGLGLASYDELGQWAEQKVEWLTFD